MDNEHLNVVKQLQAKDVEVIKCLGLNDLAVLRQLKENNLKEEDNKNIGKTTSLGHPSL